MWGGEEDWNDAQSMLVGYLVIDRLVNAVHGFLQGVTSMGAEKERCVGEEAGLARAAILLSMLAKTLPEGKVMLLIGKVDSWDVSRSSFH